MGKEGGGLLSFSLSADDIFFCQGVTFTFCLLQISKAQFLSGLMGQLPHKTCPPANIYQLPHKMGPLTSIQDLSPPQTSIRAQEPEKKQTIAMLRNHQKPSTKHKFSKSHFLKTSFASTCPVKDLCLSVEMSFSPLSAFQHSNCLVLFSLNIHPF